MTKFGIKEEVRKILHPNATVQLSQSLSIGIVGNILLSVAFTLLVLSILVFLAGNVSVSDDLVLVAVSTFLMGAISKIIHGLRKVYDGNTKT